MSKARFIIHWMTPDCDTGTQWLPGTILPKDEEVLKLVERKIAAGEKVLIYTNWTRLDTQQRLQKLLLSGHG